MYPNHPNSFDMMTSPMIRLTNPITVLINPKLPMCLSDQSSMSSPFM